MSEIFNQLRFWRVRRDYSTLALVSDLDASATSHTAIEVRFAVFTANLTFASFAIARLVQLLRASTVFNLLNIAALEVAVVLVVQTVRAANGRIPDIAVAARISIAHAVLRFSNVVCALRDTRIRISIAVDATNWYVEVATIYRVAVEGRFISEYFVASQLLL